MNSTLKVVFNLKLKLHGSEQIAWKIDSIYHDETLSSTVQFQANNFQKYNVIFNFNSFIHS